MNKTAVLYKSYYGTTKATPYNKRKELRRTAAITNSAGMLWFLIAQAH